MTTIKSVKKALELRLSKVSAIEVYYDIFSSVHMKGIHTDTIHSVVEELSDSLDMLPDDMPVVQFEIMDEDEYSRTVEANCAHIPFSDYLEGENPTILVVVLPQNWEEYVQYYTIGASTGEVDDVEYNDMGGFCYWEENIGPLFSDNDGLIRKFKVEEEAKKQLAKIQKYYQEHLDFNEEVYLYTIRHYMEDGELCQDDAENDTCVSYSFRDITGAVVAKWSWVTYIGYARKFEEVFHVSEFDTCHDESLLIQKDDVHGSNFSLIFTVEEARELEENGTYNERLKEELLYKGWKWTNPGSVRASLED